MTKLEPSTGMQARQAENLEWYVRLLCGEEPMPENPFARNPYLDQPDADLAGRFSPEWRNPLQIFTHAMMRHYSNGHAPYSRRDISFEDGRICMRDAIGHVWQDEFFFDGDGNFSSLVVHTKLADGYQVRLMESKDIQGVEDMNQVARIQVDDGSCSIDRKGTTQAYINLLEDNLVAVVEDATGEVISVGAAAFTKLRLDGKTYFLQYTNHFRTHRNHRNYTFMRVVMSKVCVPKYDKVDGTFFIMHGRNHRMLKTAPSLWTAGAFRAVFDCARIASEPFGYVTSPDEVHEVLPILNQTHEKLELFFPYTAQSLTARLERYPQAYSWTNLKRTDNAVLGTWFSGEERHYEMPDSSWKETRGLVLDYGCKAGCEDELEALIRSAAREALAKGISHLTLFVSERSPVFNSINKLADHLELYRVNCSLAEPKETAARGVFIDPILA